MFQYSSKSLFSPVREELKILFLLVVFAAAFMTSNYLVLAVLFVFLTALLVLAGYKDFFKLFASINLRILCIFTATAFFTFSTDIFALLKLMKKLYFPEEIYLPFYVLFRFLPEIEQDLSEIIGIQKIRGISKKRPLFYIKSILLPLLFTSLQKADDLAIAYYLRKKRETN